MKKHCFYHILAKNDYVQIHNRIFAKIISNPFFDDAKFYFSVIGDAGWDDRLIMPKIPPVIKRYKDTGSELPALLMMRDHSNKIEDEDAEAGFFRTGMAALVSIPSYGTIFSSMLASFFNAMGIPVSNPMYWFISSSIFILLVLILIAAVLKNGYVL